LTRISERKGKSMMLFIISFSLTYLGFFLFKQEVEGNGVISLPEVYKHVSIGLSFFFSCLISAFFYAIVYEDRGAD
jgi:hypothetical protein